MIGLIDILMLLPQPFKDQTRDALVDFVAGQAERLPAAGGLGARIRQLRSDALFMRNFEQGLARAVQRFLTEYEGVDEDLTAAIGADREFFRNPQLQAALLEVLRHPGTYREGERERVVQSFDAVFPERKNRERVDRAVSSLLRCLAEEVWHLPELQPIYSLQFQRLAAEALQQQVALQKAQLHAQLELSHSTREVLLELTDALARAQALPAPRQPALPAHPRIYHNLPQPDYGRFVGREAELAQVVRILRPYPGSQHALVTIDGIGGIGKSALALEVAHRYLRNYDQIPPEERFEAVIWISAKQNVLTAEGIKPRAQSLRTLEDIYTTIAVTLDREDITRARPEEQAEVVRKALIQQRTLLIIDNLETVDDERVLEFLRELPAPTKSIVTTRHRIDVAYPVRLLGMPEKDSRALIAQECAKRFVTLSASEIDRLYTHTGGVPLAIVWSLAKMGLGYDSAAVLDRLGRPNSDISRFCFNEAVAVLQDKPAAVLLLALSLFTPDGSRDALGAVSELSELDRDDGLVLLEKLSLVNKKGNRFSLLPLTKTFALSELARSERKGRLQERWIAYFRESSEKYSSEFWNWKDYNWLLLEGENILAIVNWAIATGEEKLALSLTRPLLPYLNIQGRWVELIEYGEKFYNLAQLVHDEQTMAWICVYWLGWLYAEQNNTERAETLVREALSIYKDLGDPRGVCTAQIYWARTLRRAGKFQASAEICAEAMALAQAQNYGDGIAGVHDALAKLARDQSRWAEAKAHWERTVEWCEEHEAEADLDISFLMSVYGNLGWAEFQLGHYSQGQELLERSLDFFKRWDGMGDITTLHWRLALIERALGDLEAALKHLHEVIFLAERLGKEPELRAARELLQELQRVV